MNRAFLLAMAALALTGCESDPPEKTNAEAFDPHNSSYKGNGTVQPEPGLPGEDRTDDVGDQAPAPSPPPPEIAAIAFDRPNPWDIRAQVNRYFDLVAENQLSQAGELWCEEKEATPITRRLRAVMPYKTNNSAAAPSDDGSAYSISLQVLEPDNGNIFDGEANVVPRAGSRGQEWCIASIGLQIHNVWPRPGASNSSAR